MIYKSSYFSKELRQAYVETMASAKRKAAFALFIGFISFALFFAAQSLRESVLYDTFPEIMQPSYFSTIYIYIHVALVLNALYYIIYYDSLFFYEIRRNSWYLLVKMGYNPAIMIFSKLTALLLSTAIVYSLGFLFILFLTYLLKFTPVYAYFPTLYLVGLIDLIVISVLAMMMSPFVKRAAGGRYFIFFSVIALFFLKIELGYYSVLSNRVAMQSIQKLFDLQSSTFPPVAAAIVLISVLICVAKAHNISQYYNLPDDHYDRVLPGSPPVVLLDSKTGRRKPVGTGEKEARRRKIFDVAVTSFLILFILATLSLNIMILFINASTLGKEVSIQGTIPYIFKSSTMEPEIMLNDLAYFEKFEGDEEIGVGQIILFEEGHVIFVERVTAKEGELYQVDIDNYPPLSQPEAMVKEVKKEAILGLYSGKNRWLGALILFANTIFGRLLFLLIPAIILFFQKPVTEWVSKQIRLN
ncbi:MAG: S26 family signal peptidase [Firmicutes bacterium]|nr:S26 family signal peptidase [Bacillota bacterium]